MYGVLRQYKVDPGAIAEITRRVEPEFVPIIKGAPGFVSYSLGTLENGELFTFSVFQDQAGADESVRLAANYVREHMAALVPNPPVITSGEIRVRQIREEEQPRTIVIRNYKTSPAAVDEVVRRTTESFTAIIGSVEGFARYALVDAGNGVAISLGAFRDRAGAEESTRRAVEWVRQTLGPLAPNPPTVTYGEILVFARA